jgi:hypothetical protein
VADPVELTPDGHLVILNDTVPLTADGHLVDNTGNSPGPQWGIFRKGKSVVTADTVIGLTYRQDWPISDYPMQPNAFQSYNKVSTPFDARVRFATGGSKDDRVALINSIAAIAGDLNLYDVVTPEVTYSSVNITHYDYDRRALDGVGLLKIDVWLIEVSVTGTATPGDSTKDAASASAFNGGTVQTTPATGNQTTAVTSAYDGIVDVNADVSAPAP